MVNRVEAERVREIFAIAAAAKSLQAAQQEIARRGLQTKEWTTRKVRRHAGKPFCKTTLRALLGNVLYIGSIRHKGTIYPGEQAAIIEPKVWERVNRQLQIRGRSQAGRLHMRRKPLLRGSLYCGQCGAAMVVTASTRQGRRYSYYTCAKAKGGGCGQASAVTEDLETAVRCQLSASVAHPDSAAEMQAMLRRVSYHSGTREVMVETREGSRWEFRMEEANRPGVRGDRVAAGRVLRISRLLALAIKLEGLVGGGELRNQAEGARLGKISRARMSQILGLRNLAPRIQEKLLFLPQRVSGREQVTEKRMRGIAQVVDWEEQEKLFAPLLTGEAGRVS